MARQLVLQYRDELLDLQVAQRSLPDKRPRWGDGQDEDDDIASDLLMVLQSIPIQVIGELRLILAPPPEMQNAARERPDDQPSTRCR